MCRHLAYLGPPVTLRAAIIDPPYGLYRQAWAPRMMRNSGTMNVDGFGVGWYADGDPVPARYRHAGPIWADPSFADLTRVTRSGALLAAVRDASAGTEPGASACSPYGADHWLFSHNGTLTGWPGSAAGLAATLSPLELLSLDARVDSALLWALTLHQLRAGATPEEALAAVIGLLDVAEVTGRFNFLLTDGATIAATAAGQHAVVPADAAPRTGQWPPGPWRPQPWRPQPWRPQPRRPRSRRPRSRRPRPWCRARWRAGQRGRRVRARRRGARLDRGAGPVTAHRHARPPSGSGHCPLRRKSTPRTPNECGARAFPTAWRAAASRAAASRTEGTPGR